jgi:MFS family permease
MVIAGLLATLSYASCSLIRPGWPIWAIFGILTLSGFFMSFQFTAYNTIAYDGIDERRMSRATAFYSTLQQLMLSIGVSVGALALRAAMVMNRHEQPRAEDFSAAFLVVTSISLTAIAWNLRFHAEAGAQMSGHARRGKKEV